MITRGERIAKRAKKNWGRIEYGVLFPIHRRNGGRSTAFGWFAVTTRELCGHNVKAMWSKGMRFDCLLPI